MCYPVLNVLRTKHEHPDDCDIYVIYSLMTAVYVKQLGDVRIKYHCCTANVTGSSERTLATCRCPQLKILSVTQNSNMVHLCFRQH